jgi:hypothetical protein
MHVGSSCPDPITDGHPDQAPLEKLWTAATPANGTSEAMTVHIDHLNT